MSNLALLLAAANLPLTAQWLDHRDSRTPRAKNGQPNLSAPAPRLHSKPDLSGVWQAARTSDMNLLPDSDLLEYVCENEKDRGHLQ